MKSSATAEFWQRFAALPVREQESARKAYQLWSRDQQHRSLRFKKIGNVWSVRVSRGYRAPVGGRTQQKITPPSCRFLQKPTFQIGLAQSRAASKLAFVQLDLVCKKAPALHRVSALGIICAFLFTIALSDAPGLHEYLHKALEPNHECAVTMFLSGTCDHSPCVTPSAGPAVLTSTLVFVSPQSQSREAGLEFSLLEHAPPFSA